MRKFLSALSVFFCACALCAQSEKQAKPDSISINHGPYVCVPAETSVEIVWTTDKPAVSWVEIAPDDETHFYSAERPKYFSSANGKKRIDTVHNVRIDGLERGKKYRYRVFSEEVLGTEGHYQVFYGKTASSKVYKAEPLTFRTLDHSKDKVSFRVVNDIHGDAARLTKLLANIEDDDFVFLNGDMTTYMGSEAQIFEGYMDAAVAATNSGKPLFFGRGNHETRGHFTEEFLKYFPTSTGMTYYTFRQGPAFFIVLDSGEDKPDGDVEYHGLADFDAFRARQAEWLKGVVASDEFRSAPVKIVFVHIPPGRTIPSVWHGEVHFKKLFAPILNSASIDLILSGHLHRYEFHQPDAGGLNVPNVVNSNMEAMDVQADKSEIKISFISAEGKEARPPLVFKTRSSK